MPGTIIVTGDLVVALQLARPLLSRSLVLSYGWERIMRTQKRHLPDHCRYYKCDEENEIGQYDNDWSGAGKLL